MNKPRILMFHGKDGSPRGTKAMHIKNNPHYEAHVPFYPAKEGPVSDVFDTCYDIAKKELHDFAPDLVIGSSFGGGILLKLITEGIWKGPSLFLAQAGVHYNIATTLPNDIPTILIHGSKDDIINAQDSRTLAASSPLARMIELPNDTHALESLLNGLLFFSIDHLLQKRQ